MNAMGGACVLCRGDRLGRRFALPGHPVIVAAAFLQRVES